MNLALSKLALLEKKLIEKEEQSRIEGYTTCPIDKEFQKKVSELMNRVRTI